MVRPDPHLPPRFTAWLAPFLTPFSRRTRPSVAALAVGALLAIGPRTVTACLRVLGVAEHPGFAAFHRVLSRNAWSSLGLARTLVRMVVAAFVPAGPIVIGVDHSLKRRRGRHIGPAGHFYDAGRSSPCDRLGPPVAADAAALAARSADRRCHGWRVRRPRVAACPANPHGGDHATTA
ncbi:MAG TPA: transposase [Roseomonas sp.]|jgi:hypothetical protein